MMGGALGLAVLVAVSDSRTASLAAAGSVARSRRCNGGLQVAFAVGAVLPRWRGRRRRRVPPAAADGDARRGGRRGGAACVRAAGRTALTAPARDAGHGGRPRSRRRLSVRRVTSLLIRAPAWSPLGPTATHPRRAPSTSLVEDGLVTAVAARARAPGPGSRSTTPTAAGWRPGLWDQHVHLAQWTLASQRLDLAAGPLARGGDSRWSPSGSRTLPGPAGHRLGPPLRRLGPRRHGLRARRGLRRHPGGADQRRRPPRLAQHHRADAPGDAGARLGGPRDRVVRGLPPAGHAGRQRRHLAARPTAAPSTRAAARGVVGHRRLRVRRRPPRTGPSAGREGCDLLRIRWATYADTLDDVIAAGPAHRRPAARLRRPRSRWGRSRSSATARSTPAPPGAASRTPTRTGWSTPPASPTSPATSCATCSRGPTARGLEVATHAIGDAAVAEALAAYAETGARGSIEHAQLVGRDDVRRMAELGVRASVQPAHLLDDRDLTELIWPGRAERCFAFRWMLDDGVELALGSDAPVSPLDPWLAIAAAVHRSADERDPWHGEQALTPAEALAASVDGQPTVGRRVTRRPGPPRRATRWPSAPTRPRLGDGAAHHAGRPDRRRRPGRALDPLAVRSRVVTADSACSTSSATAACRRRSGWYAAATPDRASTPLTQASAPAQMSCPSLGPSTVDVRRPRCGRRLAHGDVHRLPLRPDERVVAGGQRQLGAGAAGRHRLRVADQQHPRCRRPAVHLGEQCLQPRTDLGWQRGQVRLGRGRPAPRTGSRSGPRRRPTCS